MLAEWITLQARHQAKIHLCYVPINKECPAGKCFAGKAIFETNLGALLCK